MTFNYDLDQMKVAIDSDVVAIPPESLTSFESFDEWLAEDATSMNEIKMKLFEVEYEKFDYIFKKDIVHGFDYIEAFDEADAKSRAIFKHGDGLDILSVVVDV